MTKFEVGELFDEIVFYYPSFTGNSKKINAWYIVLQNVPFDLALENLHLYVGNPENKYSPHPGALSVERKSDDDRYHDYMRISGMQMLEEAERMHKNAVPPTDEQRRKVRELIAKRGSNDMGTGSQP